MTTEAERLPRFPTVLRKMWSGGEVQNWIDQNMTPLLRSQAAEIERLGAENSRWIGLADRWAQECKTEQRLSFRDQVGKLEAEIERLKAENASCVKCLGEAMQDTYDANDLLRQALDVAERQAEIIGPTAIGTHGLIAAIKQHLGG